MIFSSEFYKISKNTFPTEHLWATFSVLGINPFHANVPFLYPMKTFGFPTFSGTLEMGHWREKG